MNTAQIKGKTDQLTGKIKQAWGRLTDDEVALYSGQKDEFFGKLQEKYGLQKEAAEKKLKEIEQSCSKAA